jgi:2-(1,2-epoxy-1,2-dihydrophenyl)acetyl-CoA isomerase
MTFVRVDRKGPVSVVTLDRAERHNSLVPEFVAEVASSLERAARDSQAIVLAAAGRTFSTGGDVREIRDAADRSGYADRLVGGLNKLLLTMMDLPLPIVAAVHGMVTGGSVGLLAASDVVVAEEHVTIRPWYSTVGFSPDGGWTALLPAVIGSARLRAVLLADEEIDAAAAHSWGLVHRVVPGGEALPSALALAGRMVGMRPGAVAAAKRLLGRRDVIAIALEAERRAFVAQVVTDEASEGMDRFLAGEFD